MQKRFCRGSISEYRYSCGLQRGTTVINQYRIVLFLFYFAQFLLVFFFGHVSREKMMVSINACNIVKVICVPPAHECVYVCHHFTV